jgi:hypothetical protein
MWLRKKSILSVVFHQWLILSTMAEFRPGMLWPDGGGSHIQAHGGGVLSQNGVYYWYGEDRTPGSEGGVSCYTSTNLYEWARKGVVLTHDQVANACGRGTFIERPKVLFNAATSNYVMWTHAEQRRYHYARAGIATSSSAIGPFTWLKAIRPIREDTGFSAEDENQQKQFGGTFRDMNLFQDDDGRAYVFYSSEDNWTMYVVRLNSAFTSPESPAVEGQTWARILVRQMREGPAPFKYNGRYYLITSACTGWKPNAAALAVADNVLGPWTSLGNPCLGERANTTYDAQSTAVLSVPGREGCFIFMADRWQPSDLSQSTYVWLPFKIKADGSFSLRWINSWSFSTFDEMLSRQP